MLTLELILPVLLVFLLVLLRLSLNKSTEYQRKKNCKIFYKLLKIREARAEILALYFIRLSH